MTGERERTMRLSRRVQRFPLALIEYPLEVLLAVWGIIAGPTAVAGLTHLPPAFPRAVTVAWGAALVVSACSIGWGLWRRAFGTVLPRGLQLLGSACLVDGIAILGLVEPRYGVPAGLLLFAIAALCYLRAWWMRARHAILGTVRKEAT